MIRDVVGRIHPSIRNTHVLHVRCCSLRGVWEDYSTSFIVLRCSAFRTSKVYLSLVCMRREEVIRCSYAIKKAILLGGRFGVVNMLQKTPKTVNVMDDSNN